MKIKWLGHSCFMITSEEYSVITDPYGKFSVPGLKDLKETANMVVCSHEHFDHNAKNRIKVKQKDACTFTITYFETYHDDVNGKKRGPNTMTLFDDGRVKAAHLGDLGCELTDDQIEGLKGVDVLMIPVGGCYTIDGRQAADIVKQLAPKHVIPMHYRDEKHGFGFKEISTLETFTDNVESVVYLELSEIDTEALPEEQVICLVPEKSRK